MDARKQARLGVFERHIRRLEERQAVLDALDQRYVLLRVGVVLGGLASVLAAATAGASGLAWGLLGGAAAVFTLLVWLHWRVDRSQLNLRLAKTLALTQRARLRLDWGGIPPAPSIVVDPTHPFASDLNLLGEHSLHQLLDTTASVGGSERLAQWLLQTVPDLEAIQNRQALIRELLPLNGFRDRLGKKGLLVKSAAKDYWNGEKLLGWLEKNSVSRNMLPVLVVLGILALSNITLYLLNALGILPAYWIVGLIVYGLIYIYRFGDYKDLFEDTYTLGRSLSQLSGVLACLEEYRYSPGSRLGELCAPFWRAAQQPSRFLRRLVWLTSAAGLGNSQVFGFLINLVLPWNFFFAYQLSGYKAALRDSLAGWLDTWYEVEALNSLANFAYLNPDYCFPRLAIGDSGVRPVFDAHGLGHPLLMDAVKVCNDFSLSRLGEVAIVTGSNMSGKSTFLRTVGVNLCLAQAGGVVNATSLSTNLVRLFTCIQVSDSLSDGISYFYAEVRRLKALLQAIQEESTYPLFFLIDEIYRGTNNRERQIGSQAYIRALASYCGVGLVSTHDLELVKLADQEMDKNTNILNYHFREEVIAERMVFDYRLRPGPCPTTNALRIMALEGLPVDQVRPQE